MRAEHHSTARPLGLRLVGPGGSEPSSFRRLPATATALLIGLGLAMVTYRYPPPALEFLVLGGIALVGVLALAIARYEWAAVLGFLILGVVKVEPAPPDVVFGVVIAVAALTGRFDLERIPLVISAAVASFAILNILSMVEAIDPTGAALYASITLYMAVFALWLAGFVTSERRARLVANGYIAAAATSALIGVAAVTLHFPGSDQFLFEDTRALALFKDANVFGPFLVLPILILLEEVLRPRLLRISRISKLLLLALLAVGVLFSFSRAAWLNLALGGFVMLVVQMIRHGGARRAPAILAIFAGAIGVAFLAIGASGSGDFLQERAGSHSYDQERFGAQQAGIELAESHPAGIGPGQFEEVVNYSAHSTFVRVLTEQGLLGSVAFLTLIIATLMLAMKNVTAGNSTYGIGSAALLGAWCGVLANGLFVDTLHWRHLWVIAALIWAGAIAARYRERVAEIPLVRRY